MMIDKPVVNADLKMARFKYVWENISDPAIHDAITGNCYFINDEDDIERIVGLLNNLHQENQQLNMSPRCDPNEIESMVKEIHCLKEENEKLRQSVEYWQRKRVEKASEIQKECFKIKDIRIEKKYCGSCKHLHLDGMFGLWCDENHDWTLFNGNCSDFER